MKKEDTNFIFSIIIGIVIGTLLYLKFHNWVDTFTFGIISFFITFIILKKHNQKDK